MIYTTLTKKAINLAFKAHKHKIGQDGVPYICHPLHLAEQMTDELTTVVALLHDVVEDTDISVENIKNSGFPDEVVDAISVITRNKNDSYEEYIMKVKTNKLATIVKVTDLKHNLDVSRLCVDCIDSKISNRMNKYRKALTVLEEP